MAKEIKRKIPLTHYEYTYDLYDRAYELYSDFLEQKRGLTIFDEISRMISNSKEPHFGMVLDATLLHLYHKMNPAEIIKEKFAQQAYHHIWFERCGKHVYRPSDGIIQTLLHADIRKVQAKYFILPYDSVYISLPPLFEVYNNITQKNQIVDGVFVTISPYSRGDLYDSIECIWTPQTRLQDSYSIVDGVREMDFQICCRDKDNMFSGTECLRHVRLVVKDDDQMQDVLNFGFSISNQVYKDDPNGYSELEKVDKPIIRLVVNLMLYITCGSKEALSHVNNDFANKIIDIEKNLMAGIKMDRKSKREYQRLTRKYREYSKLPYYLVGANVKIKGTITKRSLMGISPHDVTKHWKMQPYGPGRQQRKLILIDTYHRGGKQA